MAGFDQLKFSTSRPLGYAETDRYNVKSGALITDRDACRHSIVVLHSLSGAQSVESGPNRELSDAHPKRSIAVLTTPELQSWMDVEAFDGNVTLPRERLQTLSNSSYLFGFAVELRSVTAIFTGCCCCCGSLLV